MEGSCLDKILREGSSLNCKSGQRAADIRYTIILPTIAHRSASNTVLVSQRSVIGRGYFCDILSPVQCCWIITYCSDLQVTLSSVLHCKGHILYIVWTLLHSKYGSDGEIYKLQAYRGFLVNISSTFVMCIIPFSKLDSGNFFFFNSVIQNRF